MLPCQTGCSHYCEGCHKNCVHWKAFLQSQKIENRKKKEYLAFHKERCMAIIRQCYQLVPYAPHT